MKNDNAGKECWTVKVDGEAVPLATVRLSNGILKAAVVKGTMIIVR